MKRKTKPADGKGVGSIGMVRLQEHERDVLDDLVYLRKKEPDRWWRPMDVGGSDASHHSRTLAKLCRLGLADKIVRGRRGSYLYRAIIQPNAVMSRPAKEE